MDSKICLLVLLCAWQVCSIPIEVNANDEDIFVFAPTPITTKLKGTTFLGFGSDYDTTQAQQSLKNVVQSGIEWIAVITEWIQDSINTTEIYRTSLTVPDDQLVTFIQYAKGLGLKILLKPHIDVSAADSQNWRGQIGTYFTAAQWNEWFLSYNSMILHYASIAAENKVDIFCVGTELSETSKQESHWRNTISKVRSAYLSNLVYAANWYLELENLRYWDALDIIGVDAYYPLTENPNPSLADLEQGWSALAPTFRNVSTTFGKPFMFTEIGYASQPGVASSPWTASNTAPVDLQIQALCYQAFFSSIWSQNWFYGVFWWAWETDPSAGGSSNNGFTPQNKPAEGILLANYAY